MEHFSSQILDSGNDGWRKRKGVLAAGMSSLECIGCAGIASYELLSVCF